MSKGTFKILRKNGQEVFPVDQATVCLFHGERGLELIFTANAGSATETLADTRDLQAEPEVEVSVFMDKVDWNSLVGKKFEIPESYNEEIDDYLTRIYYVEHEDLDDCIIEVLERNSKGEYFVKLTGQCIDINNTEDDDLSAKILIEAWFAAEEKNPTIVNSK